MIIISNINKINQEAILVQESEVWKIPPTTKVRIWAAFHIFSRFYLPKIKLILIHFCYPNWIQEQKQDQYHQKVLDQDQYHQKVLDQDQDLLTPSSIPIAINYQIIN